MDDEKALKLVAEITNLEASSKKHASRNHRYAYMIAIAAVLGSVSAAIMVNIEGVPNYATAAAAILPAAVSAVTSILRFEPKSQWFYERLHKLSELRRKLEFEEAEPETVSQELSHLEQEYQNNWVKFGSSTGQENFNASDK